MENNKLNLYLLLSLNMALWGGGWIANKLIVHEANIIVLTFWRFFITFIALVPIFFIVKKPIIINKHILKITTFGAVLNISFMLIAFLGVMHGFAGRAGVVITTLSPIITFLLVSYLYKYRLKYQQMLGLFLGFTGGLLMFEIWKFDFSMMLNDGSFYFILCAFIWSFVTIASSKSHESMDPFHYTIILTGIGSVILFIASLPFDIFVVFQKDTQFWIALLYISVLAQGVASTIYYYASGKIGSASTSSFLFIVPVTALFFSWLILDEIPTVYLLIGGAINILALFVISKAKK